MAYSQIIFNKDLYELTYTDVANFFITRKEETINLEFKSYPEQGNHSGKENSVLKAVCGLLNSEGGIIIWGAPEEVSDDQGNTSAIGSLTPFETTLDRDRLINKISSLIIPLPVGIKVQKLDAPSRNSIFIIEVMKSIHKPHQYKNHYYIRLDGQTKIAPHYLIESMMKSVSYPIIRGHLRLKRIERQGNNIVISLRKLIYNTSPLINELNLSFKLIAGPGRMIINDTAYQGFYDGSVEILGHGRPLMSDFDLIVSSIELQRNNNQVQIALNFVGEKSPSKTSVYTYSLTNITLGAVANENDYIIERIENGISSDVSGESDDEKITYLLDFD